MGCAGRDFDNRIETVEKRLREDPVIEIEIGPGRKRLMRKSVYDRMVNEPPKKRVAPAMHDVMDAHNERYKKWYGEPPPPVIEDYRCEAAKKEWPGYTRIKTPQGWKEGPPPFKSYAEQSLYERTYGFHQETGKRSDQARSLKEQRR